MKFTYGSKPASGELPVSGSQNGKMNFFKVTVVGCGTDVI
jgi:hypothetical protein